MSFLSRPKHGLVDPLKKLFFGPRKEVRELIPELEEQLLLADVGVPTTSFLIESIEKAGLKKSEEAYAFLKEKITEILSQASKIPPSPPERFHPRVFFFIGVNGVGKTTTIGKLAHRFQAEGLKPMLAAADTFRAAAKDQLKIWAERSHSEFVGGADNADPASVVFDGLSAAKARGCDMILVDTAGRLHTKANLMEELKKMVRVAEKAIGRPPDEIFLVLDATTGQNGLAQARLFLGAVPLTGLILTKYDGTAKGGILISIVRETGLPLKFVGVGEKVEDLKLFDAHEFVEALFE